MESALVIPVPEAAAVVDPWRERTAQDKPSIGVPAHVTLLYPFVPAPVPGDVIGELRELFARIEPFAYTLRRTARFPDILYLAPEPPEPFVRMTEQLHARWPEYPPYGGDHDEIVPHVSVAYGDEALLDEAERDVSPQLPIEADANEALLLEEVVPDWGRWKTRARLTLGLRYERVPPTETRTRRQ